MDSVPLCRVNLWVLSVQTEYKWSQLLTYWESVKYCLEYAQFFNSWKLASAYCMLELH